MHDYPHDVELGITDHDYRGDEDVTLRCGCVRAANDRTHDEADCLDAQAEFEAELAAEARRG